MRPTGFHHTTETKRKMVEHHSRWNKGLTKAISESLSKQSSSLSKHWQATPHPKGMLGKHHSLATREVMSHNRQGMLNGNWKGGITEGVRLFRKSRRYQQWRHEVLGNAKYQCATCSKKATIAHHIKSIKLYPELRFDIDNGMAVCSGCHRKIHKRESGND